MSELPMSDRSVVWITLESVRQDHTSLGEYRRDTTPNLRRITHEPNSGAFTNCFSHGIWTRTSTASILTGRAPTDHGVLSATDSLSDDVTTIPERFSRRGYRTVCVSPIAQVSRATGLDRGFTRFDYLSRSTLLETVDAPTLLRYLFNIRRHSAGFTTEAKKHCLGYLNTSVAKNHIRRAKRGGEPIFLYVHLGDSHHAYYPPRGWRSQFADDLAVPLDEALSIALDMSDRLIEHIASDSPFTAAEWNAITVMYDTTLSYVDYLTGTLVEYARAHLDDPIIVITADHGELFGERGCLAHMLVANSAVSNVPLVVSGLDGVTSTRRDPVQHADVLQMICDDLHLPATIPVGTDVRAEPRMAAVTQRGGERARAKMETLSEHDPEFDSSPYHKGNLTSVVTEAYRYQRSDSGEVLFALPDETTDVSSEAPDELEHLRTICDEWLDEHTVSRESRNPDFSEEMAQQLRELGYL